MKFPAAAVSSDRARSMDERHIVAENTTPIPGLPWTRKTFSKKSMRCAAVNGPTSQGSGAIGTALPVVTHKAIRYWTMIFPVPSQAVNEHTGPNLQPMAIHSQFLCILHIATPFSKRQF